MTIHETRLKSALTSGRYALVGAGQLGAMSLAMWPAGVVRPELVLDSIRTGELDGIAIADLPTHRNRPDLTYLLSAFKMPPSAINAIFDRLGQPDVLTVYDIFEEYIPSLFTNGWRNLAPSAEVQDRLSALPDLYADALSREICAAVTAWRYRRDLVDAYPVGPEDDKYDLSRLGRAGQHYDIVYDGGSYDLGLLDSLATAGVSWDRVVAFEPDPASHAVCLDRAKTDTAISVDPRALSNTAGQARFLANGLLASRLIADEPLSHADLIDVPTCRLDDAHSDLFNDSAPKRILLKLHIEGAELPALQGAQDLLTRHHVDILANLSHDEASWLDLPAWLSDLGRHDLLLRSHALFGEGLTLFARSRA